MDISSLVRADAFIVARIRAGIKTKRKKAGLHALDRPPSLVRIAGVEPARPRAGDFKSPVSAIPPYPQYATIIIAEDGRESKTREKTCR